jgi:hypothetical protein
VSAQSDTYDEVMEQGIVDLVIVVDDASHDAKVAIARTLPNVQVEVYPCVLASRILGGCALDGGIPGWKYFASRFLTFAENFLIGAKHSEYHTGYRAFARSLLERLPIEQNSNYFVFDNRILGEIIWLGCKIGEVTCPAKYLPEGFSINFQRSVHYGFGCLATAAQFRLARWGFRRPGVSEIVGDS